MVCLWPNVITNLHSENYPITQDLCFKRYHYLVKIHTSLQCTVPSGMWSIPLCFSVYTKFSKNELNLRN
uniref:Uncharacterized protein n=1 Tax=Nothobranchius furzeri TaxID=105023 RepID=A0A8C6LZL9_NOTFU